MHRKSTVHIVNVSKTGPRGHVFQKSGTHTIVIIMLGPGYGFVYTKLMFPSMLFLNKHVYVSQGVLFFFQWAHKSSCCLLHFSTTTILQNSLWPTEKLHQAMRSNYTSTFVGTDNTFIQCIHVHVLNSAHDTTDVKMS